MASTSTIATRKLFYFFDDSFQPLSFTPHVMYMPENSHVHQLRTSIYDNTDPENSFPTKYREHPRGRQFRIFKAPKSVLIALASFQPAFTYATAIPGDSVLLPSDALPSRTQKSFFLVVLPSLSTPLPSLPLVHSNKFIRFHTRGKNFFQRPRSQSISIHSLTNGTRPPC
ncbi:hypothetical protein BDP27DRAFT_261538 [Rhodocollybia butyracea]|uniref:Uncharacterized protein n=1 Tax=Rhodocollybia butyracea TaxID=206335 RepID=A0A9P5Q315_9AGAR|nr:hypothetical protein BDP27DRAFT_261538 [Rhodocollybia butyracea]